MTLAVTNIHRAAAVVDQLGRIGVREVVACAGARNAPLLKVLFECEGLQITQLFEERSAAFFALGRTKASGAPTAVVTTSGTAAAELFPAVIEAYYSNLPLILVTADRPPEYRGSGAPQSIEQVGLFGRYVERCIDVSDDIDLSIDDWSLTRPVHVNIGFDEPLIDALIPQSEVQRTSIYPKASNQLDLEAVSAHTASLNRFLEHCPRPLVVVGELPKEMAGEVRDFLLRFKAPVYLEALSQLRGDLRIEHLRIKSGDRFVKAACDFGDFDGILRLGGVPTLRTWRDLDGSLRDLRVLSLSDRPFSGLGRDYGGSGLLPLGHLKTWTGKRVPSRERNNLLMRDSECFEKLVDLIDSLPRSEPSLISELSKRIGVEDFVYLGNSLPIRHWDLAAIPGKSPGLVGANRGVNGIDGQVSTFLGMCRPDGVNLALLGDLTTLYDQVGFFTASKFQSDLEFTVLVINNGGGRIFGHIFDDERFLNLHTLTFENLAKQWSLDYQVWEKIPDSPSFGGRNLIEIKPSEDETNRFFEAYSAFWS